ncbi:hemerythrin domain-containing protein [Aliikangiella sp. IMCC44359]|uniref:hemerythrin domain-containing protein n=1 Tax=Aliikangiella sp. IMCC44359 TaxID=3459125 RepID=UPI00403AE932
MAKLVDELQHEHKNIVGNLNQIKMLGVTSSEGQNKLRLVKKSLLAHLKKEDERLYPLLKSAAQSNPELKRILDMFAKDMDKISKDAMAFFDKYSNGGSGLEFAKDFGTLLAILSQRIHKEENIIYAKYRDIA